ncbi:MAG: hypothetical protein ACRBK7_18655 [Acidimicrobiales bacterium]
MTGQSTTSGSRGKHDPDAIAALQDQLDVQLRSLDDLQAEFEAGDMDAGDYETLKDDYTVRVADTMRALNQQNDLAGGRTKRRINPVAIVGLVVFAALSGWLLARSTGERGINDILTGDISSTRQRVFDCQETAAGGEIVEALRCFDDVLLEDPDNPEALSYRGWYVVITAPAADAAGDAGQAAQLLETGLTYLDRAVDIDPTFPDARAFRASVYDRQGNGALACAEVATLISLDPPPFFIQQTQGIVDRNNC